MNNYRFVEVFMCPLNGENAGPVRRFTLFYFCFCRIIIGWHYLVSC